MPVEIGTRFEDKKANVRSVNPNTLTATHFHTPLCYVPSYIIESNQRVRTAVHRIPYNCNNMAHVCTTHKDITGMVPILTAYYMENIAFHFCKLRHRDVHCSAFADMMHSGSHPLIKVVYIAPDLQAAARVIIREMNAIFPAEAEAEDDGLHGINVQHPVQKRASVILTCPGCGVKFASQ